MMKTKWMQHMVHVRYAMCAHLHSLSVEVNEEVSDKLSATKIQLFIIKLVIFINIRIFSWHDHFSWLFVLVRFFKRRRHCRQRGLSVSINLNLIDCDTTRIFVHIYMIFVYVLMYKYRIKPPNSILESCDRSTVFSSNQLPMCTSWYIYLFFNHFYLFLAHCCSFSARHTNGRTRRCS